MDAWVYRVEHSPVRVSIMLSLSSWAGPLGIQSTPTPSFQTLLEEYGNDFPLLPVGRQVLPSHHQSHSCICLSSLSIYLGQKLIFWDIFLSCFISSKLTQLHCCQVLAFTPLFFWWDGSIPWSLFSGFVCHFHLCPLFLISLESVGPSSLILFFQITSLVKDSWGNSGLPLSAIFTESYCQFDLNLYTIN